MTQSHLRVVDINKYDCARNVFNIAFSFLACNEQVHDSDTYRPPSITDIWYEPVYDECVYAGTIEIEGAIHMMYGSAIRPITFCAEDF